MGLQEQHAKPALPVKVSISSVKKTFLINFRGEKRHITADITVTVDINGIRGAHISRLVEAIHYAASGNTLEDIGDKIIQFLEQNHSISSYLCAKIEFTTTITYNSPITNNLEEIPINVCYIVEKSGGIKKYRYEFTLFTTSACPNMIALNGKLTHTQRGLTTISIETNEKINLDELIKCCLHSVSLTHSLLKIPQEKKLVQSVCETPAFSEDIVRKIACEIAKLSLPENAIIRIRHISQESIHPFDIIAEGEWILKDIRQKLTNQK